MQSTGPVDRCASRGSREDAPVHRSAASRRRALSQPPHLTVGHRLAAPAHSIHWCFWENYVLLFYLYSTLFTVVRVHALSTLLQYTVLYNIKIHLAYFRYKY